MTLSRKKFIFNDIIERIKSLKKLTTDADIANLLGLQRTALAERKRRNSIPYEELVIFSDKEKLNLHWLLTGEGDIFTTSPAPADAEACEPLIQRIADLLKDMDEERKEDILRYIEKEKLMMELMKERHKI